MTDSIDLNDLHPIDFVDVLDRIGGDSSFLLELLDIYFREYDEKKPLLDDAIAREDYVQMQELGHSLKGASANLGLARLQRAAFALEMAGRERQILLAKEAAQSLESEIQALRVYLERNPLV